MKLTRTPEALIVSIEKDEDCPLCSKIDLMLIHKDHATFIVNPKDGSNITVVPKEKDNSGYN